MAQLFSLGIIQAFMRLKLKKLGLLLMSCINLKSAVPADLSIAIRMLPRRRAHKPCGIMKAFFIITFVFANLVQTHADDYLPVADGTVYSSGAANTSFYVEIGPTMDGDAQFKSFSASSYTSIQLKLSPYGMPMYGNPVYVYGYDNAAGYLSGTDYNTGTYLGALVLPGPVFGDEVFFDVTDFVKSVKGEYFGFDLRVSSGIDLFGSSYLGAPTELIATVPEPSATILFGLAIGSTIVFSGIFCRHSSNAI